MLVRLILGFLLIALPASAQDFPALFRVTGVSAGDVLNIRAEPSARAAIVGQFPRTATQIEVVGLSEDRTWGLVRTGEGIGWSNMRFLARERPEPWHEGTQTLTCHGTEPFWSMTFFLPDTRAEYVAPDDSWEVRVESRMRTLFPPTLAMTFSGAHKGVVVLRNGVCSNGMSDALYGLEAQLYRVDQPEGVTGCCSLGP